MNDVIFLSDVLEQMDQLDANGNPVPFDIIFCTNNRKTGDGGRRITMKRAIKVVGKDSSGGLVLDRTAPKTSYSKNPNLYKNAQRLIVTLGTNEIRKVHIRLIEFFNNKQVIW
jgi:hypothetical protein